MYELRGKVGEDRTRIDVTHSCGHVQVCTPLTRMIERGEEQFPGFTERQYSWLSRNLCPGCFGAAKLENPNFKPTE